MEEKGTLRYCQWSLDECHLNTGLDKQQLPGILIGGKFPGVRVDSLSYLSVQTGFNTLYLLQTFSDL